MQVARYFAECSVSIIVVKEILTAELGDIKIRIPIIVIISRGRSLGEAAKAEVVCERHQEQDQRGPSDPDHHVVHQGGRILMFRTAPGAFHLPRRPACT